MYQYNEIRTVHLEITERCNAACLMCPRNINGGEENPFLPKKELYIDDIKRILTPKFLNQLSHIYMCGNYGDPIVARDTLAVFKYLRGENPNLLLSINTNGSAKTESWWKELAEVYGENGYVIFSIDGLESTNHLYRQNTTWSKIINNAKAFIDAGGKARWEFIVFNHNEHQVEEARQLSIDLGFEEFIVKKSARFISPLTGQLKETSMLVNRKGESISLAPPGDSKYKNVAVEQIGTLGQKANYVLPTKVDEIQSRLMPEIFEKNDARKRPIEKYWDKTVIKCKVSTEKSLYISAEGLALPCCWMAGQMYTWYWSPRGSQVWRLINKIGKQNLSVLTNDIETVVSNQFFQEHIPESWNKPSCAEGKLSICAKTCGTEFDTFQNQYS